MHIIKYTSKYIDKEQAIVKYVVGNNDYNASKF